MTNEAPIPPTLPTYQKPAPRPVATLPTGMAIQTLGVMGKMITRSLTAKKGAPRMSARKGKGISTSSTIKFKGKAFKAGKKKSQFE